MPLKATVPGQSPITMGPGGHTTTTKDGVKITWSGDGNGDEHNWVTAHDADGNTLVSAQLAEVGVKTEANYTVYIKPIEKGGKLTEVERSVGLERI